ncbi:hypothetical protein M513_13147 [Trichuris suis]|uniref:Uncharacterized protein n=1 Tax=Trichuris suis TaxID=68888 RepID=A0A085LLZ5_9BILA|nr:hypothetical protein M513_13147 [Trichuris suis]
MKGAALEAVTGLSLTSTKYAVAVDLLKNCFGRPKAIIQNHSAALLELQASAERLRHLHDELIWHVTALCAVGKDPARQMTAAEVLLAIFKLKMPYFLRKKWENEVLTGKEEVTLDSFFEFLRTQVEVEESVKGRTVGSHQKPFNLLQPKHITSRERFETW